MTGEGVNVFAILMMIVLPLALGAITGLIGAKVLKKECNKWQTILKVTALIILTVAIGVYINENILSINLVLSGISFAAFIANMVEEERLNEIMKDINPIMGIALVLVILDLGAPLDYNLIFGAGLLTAIYIISRGLGKIVGSYTGGKISKAEKNVCKYLGLSLLPHSGVSLIFTGIAVSTLSPYVPEHAAMIQGTIAAAAVINEIIAVFLAKQAFKMSGEIKLEKKERLDEVIN